MTRAQAGELAPEERAELKAWLSAAPEHAAAMDLVSRAWTGLGRLDHRPAPTPVRARTARPARTESRGHGLAWAGGAGLVLASVLAALVWMGARSDARYVTQGAETGVARLDDGTTIRLARDTELEVHEDLFARRATLLRGQAEFEVVHDARRPFQVETRRMTVRDLGTRFLIRDRGGAIRTAVREGRVALTDRLTGRPLAELSAGQEAEVGGEAGAASIAVTAAATTLPGGPSRMLLHDTPLAAAVAELEWRTGADILLKDPELAKVRLSGVYRTAEVASFLNALVQIEPIRWRTTARDVYVVEPIAGGQKTR